MEMTRLAPARPAPAPNIGPRRLDAASLDLRLAEDESNSAFDARLESLLRELEDVAFDFPDTTPRREGPLVLDAALRTALRDGQMSHYAREVARIPRMDRADEQRLGRRFDFVRARFRAALTAASVGVKEVDELLESSLSDSELEERGLSLDARAASALREVRAVRREWVERNLHVVIYVTLAYRTYGVPLLDLVQEGNGSLIRAAEKFDWRKGVLFRTYATFWVRQAVERAIAAAKGIVRVPNYLQQKMRRLRREGRLPKRDEKVALGDVAREFEVTPQVALRLLETERSPRSLDAVFGVDDREPLAAALAADESIDERPAFEQVLLSQRIEEALSRLSETEREILELRFGLNGRAPKTLEEVGRVLEVSRERVRQIQVRALKSLQTSSHAGRLACFV